MSRFRFTRPPRPLERKILPWLLLALALTLVLGMFTGRAAFQFVTAMRWVAHTHEVINNLGETLAAVQDAQDAQQRFVLIGQPRSVTDCAASSARASSCLDRIELLTRDNPLQQVRVTELRRDVRQELGILTQTMAVPFLPADAVAQVAAVGRGQTGLQAVRRDVALMESEEQDLLTLRTRAGRDSLREAGLWAAAFLFLDTALFLVVVCIVRADLRVRAEAAAALQEREAALRESEARFIAFMDNSPAAAFIKDEAGRYVYVNRPFETMFGILRSACLGRTPFDLFPKHMAEEMHAEHREALAGNSVLHLTMDVPGADGILRQWRVSRFAFAGHDGERMVGSITLDVSELAQANARLEEANACLRALAASDPLTGLANRRALDDALAAEWERAHRYATPLSVLLLDVDHFKRFNDNYGHPEGDSALQTVARVLHSHARDSDTVARFGGEEFVLVLPHTDGAGALSLAERIREAMEAMPWPSGAVVTVSVGIATLEAATPGPDALLREADRALYVSKAEGRNRVTHHAGQPALWTDDEP